MEHVKKFTNFTIIFCWKVNNIEHSIIILKDEIPFSTSKQESLDAVIKRVFNQIIIDIFEEFVLMFFSEIKKLTYRYYMNQPMKMIQRKMIGRFLMHGGNYRYQ